jgi:(S)-2-hydroxyglutarate dehydrogenase
LGSAARIVPAAVARGIPLLEDSGGAPERPSGNLRPAPRTSEATTLSARPPDAVVVGAGILGLASACELLRRRPDWAIVVIEKEPVPARHQTGRNSGVIHSGVYYAPGSLKARLCRRGRELLLGFCEEAGIPYDLCGKVIVATDDGERPALGELARRGRANGVEIEEIDADRLRELEPHCRGAAALHLRETGILDFGAVTRALAARFESAGGELLLGARVLALDERRDEVRIETTRGDLSARYLIACAGVHADALAGERASETRILPFRGDYFALRPEARRLCRNLIYPVPDPRFPFLGVHVNRRPDGEVWAGPNAVLALAKEGYRRRDLKPPDAWEALTYPGFLRLARRYWRTGALELYRDLFRRAYAAQARRYLPELEAEDLLPAPAGIRAQAVARDGSLVDDFLFARSPRAVHVRNAPSPAATSALAIAEHVVSEALAVFDEPAVQPGDV